MTNGSVIGSEGFIAWFYAVTWKLLRNASKNIYAKYVIHTVGLVFIIVGLYPLLRFVHPAYQFIGIVMILIGIVVFVTPFGVKRDN